MLPETTRDRATAQNRATPQDLVNAPTHTDAGRWHDHALAAADLLFDVDADGRFTFVAPDPALGYAAADLLGQSASRLLADAAGDGNPFRAKDAVRGRVVWARRKDGRVCRLSVSVQPLRTAAGRPAGLRGAATDLTAQAAAADSALRRADVLDRILARTRQETQPARMVQAILTMLCGALDADGAAILDTVPSDASRGEAARHQCGSGLAGVLDSALRLAAPDIAAAGDIREGRGPYGHAILCAVFDTRFGGRLALTAWRGGNQPAWLPDDGKLARAVGTIALMLLDHETVQHELALQARTDPLTGLLNRRAFLDELPRHLARLDRDEMGGTLIRADLDSFKTVNERIGPDAGDAALRQVAELLRSTFRPTDLVARLGGDEFAVWLNGADQFTAAERAESLRVQTPRLLAPLTGAGHPPLTLSIGLAARHTRSAEDLDGLFLRAGLALHAVKRGGRAHWRTAADFEE